MDASKVNVSHCDCCDSVHIVLINADDEPYTRARLNLEDIPAFIDTVNRTVAEIKRLKKLRLN